MDTINAFLLTLKFGECFRLVSAIRPPSVRSTTTKKISRPGMKDAFVTRGTHLDKYELGSMYDSFDQLPHDNHLM